MERPLTYEGEEVCRGRVY